VFPGLSRSGTTIAAGLGVGLERSWAARFSFLLGVPAVAGVTVVELLSHRVELAATSGSFALACIGGAATAFIAGYIALGIVLKTVSSRVFHRFAWYCIPVGLVVLVIVARAG
jgi:undecaprenyl-diphosphatase